MRIDLTQTSANQIANDPTNPNPVTATETSPSDLAATEDRTTLSSAPQSLSELVSTAMSSPDVRQDKIDALTQSIASGKYELDPEKIASSMIDEHA